MFDVQQVLTNCTSIITSYGFCHIYVIYAYTIIYLYIYTQSNSSTRWCSGFTHCKIPGTLRIRDVFCDALGDQWDTGIPLNGMSTSLTIQWDTNYQDKYQITSHEKWWYDGEMISDVYYSFVRRSGIQQWILNDLM